MCEFVEKLQNDLQELIGFLQTYQSVIDSHLNEYITSDLSALFDWKTHSESEYLKETQRLGTIEDKRYEYGNICVNICLSSSDKNKDVAQMNTFTGEKKQHEVKELSQVVFNMSQKVECKNFLDFGSGKGYLGYELSHNYNFNCVGIDGRRGNIESSEKRSLKLKRQQPNNSAGVFENIEMEITLFLEQDSKFFIEEVKNKFAKTCNEDTCVLVGLHACGGLTSTAIKLFVNEQRYFKGLLIVGCCYNLLTPHDFPMSRYVKDRGFILGKHSSMLACQTPRKRDTDKQVLSKSILYRAILEKILKDYNFDLTELRKVRFRKVGERSKDFHEYMLIVHQRFKTAGIAFSLEKSVIEHYWVLYKNSWNEIQTFYRRRIQLAPCIERLILLDRLIYLMEKGLKNCGVVRVFSPVLSPRCYAILCQQN